MADDSQVWEADEGNAQLLIEEGVRRAAAGEVDEARRFLMRALEAFRRLGQIAGQAGSLLLVDAEHGHAPTKARRTHLGAEGSITDE